MEETPDAVSSLGRGVAQGATFGFADELTGALEAAGSSVADMFRDGADEELTIGENAWPNFNPLLRADCNFRPIFVPAANLLLSPSNPRLK